MGGKRNRNKNKKNTGKEEKNEEIKTDEVENDTVEDETPTPVVNTSSEYQETSAESPEKSSKASEITPTLEESKLSPLPPSLQEPKSEVSKINEEHKAEILSKVEAVEPTTSHIAQEEKKEPKAKDTQPEALLKDSKDSSSSTTQARDSSDSHPRIPDSPAKSTITHSSIDNPPIDDSALDSSLTESPPIFPKKPTIYTELTPEIEPYYKKFQTTKAKEYEFSIHYETQFGEKIVLVGESEELGQWDVTKGISLNWNQDHCWTERVRLSKVPVEYKYVCLSNEQSIWEKGINHVIDGNTGYIKDSWQAI